MNVKWYNLDMLSVDLLRNDFERVCKKLKDRNFDVSKLDDILKMDVAIRDLKTQLQDLNEQRNKASASISQLLKEQKHTEVEQIKQEVLNSKKKIDDLETKINELQSEMTQLVSYIPNICNDIVPVGKDESANLEVKRWGTPRSFDFPSQAHWDLGKEKKFFLPDIATKVTGSRFALYYGEGAKLYRALQQFTLDMNIAAGFIEVCPEVIINSDSLYGTGQFPKFKEDVFKLEGMNYYLSPTAEVQLTNIYRDVIINEPLPIKFTANTNCFRSEAGSAGRDTRGVIRLHQFSKTELVCFAHPQDSYQQLENITRQAESILEKLELPYRRLLLSTGDTGFSSAQTFDVEVWLPSYNDYKEISSCSNCLDFQARRAKIRFKNEEGKNELVHTLNGSSLAIDRLWVAVVENYQNPDGTITIPQALVPYMNNKNKIG